jgi:hypothetical protein
MTKQQEVNVSKALLLDDLEKEYARFEALLAQVGDARMTEPGVTGHWSIKDVVAHLTGWRRRTAARLQAAARGGPEPAPPWPPHLQTDDEINAWIYEANRDRPLAEVLHDSRQVFDALVEAIRALPESDVTDPNRFYWMGGQPLTAAALFSHFHEEHEPGIRAWLQENGLQGSR